MIELAVYRLVTVHGLLVRAGCVTRGPGSLPRVKLRSKCTGLSSNCILARWAVHLPVLVARSIQLTVKLRVCISSSISLRRPTDRPLPGSGRPAFKFQLEVGFSKSTAARSL
jgi:hypothetical protein